MIVEVPYWPEQARTLESSVELFQTLIFEAIGVTHD